MNLSDLQNKEVIDILTGKRIGNIVDVIIALDGTISKLVLEDRKIGKKLFSSTREAPTINWKQIVKIGDDIILVEIKD